MAACQNCGAVLAFTGATATCPFCDVVNQAPPKEVQVAIPVQVIHQTVNVASTGDASAPVGLRCPQCSRRLAKVQVKDVELNGCGACGGIWVDNQSAKKMMSAPEEVYDDLARRCAVGAKNRAKRTAEPKCAACSVPLDPVVNRQLKLELDICAEHGTWFDAFELSTLIRGLLAKNKADAESAGPKQEPRVACAGCGKTFAAAQANITGRGPMCDACWRAEQERLLGQGQDMNAFANTPGMQASSQFHDPIVANRGTAAIGLTVGVLGVIGAAFDTSTRSRR
jgi:Zn-finger nucleic acid-binding protein